MNYEIIQGDCIETMRQLPAGSVQCCVTSPPYLNLRSYLPDDHPDKHREIGAEQSVEEYVGKLVEVFREVRRLLHPTGVLFLNLGDSYNGSGGAGGDYAEGGLKEGQPKYRGSRMGNLKPKDLIGVPWETAFALRADGWYLRSEIIWAKKSAMPECLDPETTVFVRHNGWVSKITLGQLADTFDAGIALPEILSPDGWVKIKNVWRTMKPAMAIEAGKVERIICSPEHRFPVSSDRRRIKIRHEEAQNIRHEGYADYLLYCPIDKFLTPTVTHWSGRQLDYSLGYLIGAYTAEGGKTGERGFRIRLTIGIDEASFAENIRQSLKSIAITPAESEDVNVRYFQFSEEWLTRMIASFVSGDVRTKMLNTELILNCPREFRQGILDGYVEGDGSDRKSGGWIAASASRRLRDDISTLASSLGIITSKGSRTQYDARTGETYYSSTLWTPYITKRQSKSGMEGIYQVPPRSRRMLDGEREMIDVEVEGHIFLIGDGLLTHNSVRDRPTKAHEQVFLLSKSPRYYYDHIAIAEPSNESSGWAIQRASGVNTWKYNDTEDRIAQTGQRIESSTPGNLGTRNKRSVWTLGPEVFREAHFAVMPTKLVEPCILAGTSAHGCCAACGAPWERVVEHHRGDAEAADRPKRTAGMNSKTSTLSLSGNGSKEWAERGGKTITVAWQPTCNCDADVVPCTVLDPFSGAATVGVVALKHGRRYIGLELNPDYIALSHDRLGKSQPLLLEVI